MFGQRTYPIGPASTTTSAQTSLMRMQVAALLNEQSFNHEVHAEKMAPIIQSLTEVLTSFPRIEPALAHELQNTLDRKGPRVNIPFPTVRPSEATKHRYAFAASSEVKIVGSFALQTLIREDATPLIDIAITMPQSLLEAKDYLDYRYFHKKAYYLACIAQGLLANQSHSFEPVFAYQDDNELQPCIILNLPSNHSEKKRRWRRLRLLVGPPPGLFPPDRLRPWMSCMRAFRTQGQESQTQDIQTTPLYNGTIASERLSGAYHAMLQHATISFPGFRSACILGRIWLRQRGFSSTIFGGGFGMFEFSSLLALSLREERQSDAAFFSLGSDGYQLFKSLIQTLASRDIVAEPIIVGKRSGGTSASIELGLPLFYDSEHEHNLLFKMSCSSYQLLKAEAQSTLNALRQPDPYKFYPVFIARLGSGPVRFDHLVDGTITLEPSMTLRKTNQLHNILNLALQDRALLINIKLEAGQIADEWSCNTSPKRESMQTSLRIGILVDPVQIARRVDLGPLAEETEAAAKYREFWGSKAELRRFGNGEIRESVTWPTPHSDSDILNMIVAYVLGKHFPRGEATISECGDDEFTCMLHPRVPTSQALQAFVPIEAAFAKLQESLRSISGHPLRLRQVSGSAPGLRYASEEPEIPTDSRHNRPLGVIVQFEGSSRWPEDILAIQHTKIAMLSKMAELLESEDQITYAAVGLEDVASNFENRAFLDLILGGVSFRLRIYHDHEAAQLSRILKEGSLHSGDRGLAARALSLHKIFFVHGPRHNQAIREACTRKPLLSPTTRLLKAWVSAHLLLPHFRDELLELIAFHIFDSPYPHMAPGSLRTAFFRILLFLSKWDWRNEPLIVNLTTSPLAQDNLDDIMVNFQAWRKVDPGLQRIALFVASNLDTDGTTWTLQDPSIVAVNRITNLAKAALAEVTRTGSALQAQPLFTHSIEDFDFVVHFSQSTLRQLSNVFATSNGMESNVKSAYEDAKEPAVCALIEELVKAFSRHVAFFHNQGRRPLLAGVWVPRPNFQDMKLASSWLTIPNEEAAELKCVTQVNRPEILHQIASIGGHLVTRIAVKGEL